MIFLLLDDHISNLIVSDWLCVNV